VVALTRTRGRPENFTHDGRSSTSFVSEFLADRHWAPSDLVRDHHAQSGRWCGSPVKLVPELRFDLGKAKKKQGNSR
jgi:hypothetical protein